MNEMVFDGGYVVRKRSPHNGTKPYYRRSIEFLAVCHWVIGFLCFGLFTFFLFLGLIYWLFKNLLFLVVFTVGHPEQKPMDIGRTEQLTLVTLIALLSGYVTYWQNDAGAEDRGGHRTKFLRGLWIWQHLANYFPVQLVISEELSTHSQTVKSNVSTTELLPGSGFHGLAPDKNYLVGYHPHGVFSTGAFVNFMTEATGFSQAFPGITPWLAVLKAHFKSPVYRDYLLSLGVISASRRGLYYLLDQNSCKKTGNFVVVVVGGASEALEARPGRYVMVISQRFGFFKLALQTGASLIPCISFGEQAMYKQVKNDRGSMIRRMQDWVEKLSTFAPPLFYARGPFPYRTPVNTVIGAPIACERVENPSHEQISALKELYLSSLKKLFRRYKEVYDPNAKDIEFV